MIGSNVLGPPSWEQEEQRKTPGCLAAEVRGTGDLGGTVSVGARRRPRASRRWEALVTVRAAAEGAGFGLAGFGGRLGGCAAAEESREVAGSRGSGGPGGGGLELWRSGGKSADSPRRLGLAHPCTPYLPPPPASEPVVRSLTARRRSRRVSRPFPGIGRGGRASGSREEERTGALVPGRRRRPHLAWAVV